MKTIALLLCACALVACGDDHPVYAPDEDAGTVPDALVCEVATVCRCERSMNEATGVWSLLCFDHECRRCDSYCAEAPSVTERDFLYDWTCDSPTLDGCGSETSWTTCKLREEAAQGQDSH